MTNTWIISPKMLTRFLGHSLLSWCQIHWKKMSFRYSHNTYLCCIVAFSYQINLKDALFNATYKIIYKINILTSSIFNIKSKGLCICYKLSLFKVSQNEGFITQHNMDDTAATAPKIYSTALRKICKLKIEISIALKPNIRSIRREILVLL